MKHRLTLGVWLLVVSCWASATIPLPEVGDGRLKVCAQNLQNYYYYYTENDRPKYNTPEGFADKTHRIVTAMLLADADIYAFCEVEARDIVLRQLADSMNAQRGGTSYMYVQDDINVPSSERTNNVKSGFIYRSDRVRPFGANTSGSWRNYYNETMRIQAFEEIATGERLTVSMNHFKSKNEGGEEMRVNTANDLVSALRSQAADPDILILGDLNSLIGEEPISILTEAGYVEQLVVYDPAAYSHCWGGGELIDHVFANASMAEQITGAGVFHISASCGPYDNSAYQYSDHDPYIVAINLTAPAEQPAECQEREDAYLPLNAGGLGEMSQQNLGGQWYWRYDDNYGAKCADLGGDDWLLTPSYDLRAAESVTMDFEHTIGYMGGSTTEDYTLLVTPDYKSIQESQWTPLDIPTYPSGRNWNFVHATVAVPEELFGERTVFAFRYNVASDITLVNDKTPTWEIKDVTIHVTCPPEKEPEEIDEGVMVNGEWKMVNGKKVLCEGRLYLQLPNGTMYNTIGQRVL